MKILQYSTLIPDNDPSRIAFSIAGLNVYWYAIISIFGYLVAISIYHIVLKWRYKVSVDPGFYYVFIGIPSILLGARIWSIIIEQIPINQIFQIRNGGLAVQGGVLFGVISALIYFPLILKKPKYHQKIKQDNGTYLILKPSVWIYADAIIPTILIGQAIGRWGNFMNGEIFGDLVTQDPNSYNSLFWLKAMFPKVYEGMIAKTNDISNNVIQGALYQPLFLYESFLNIVLFLFIYVFIPFFKEIKIGVISGAYFLGYGIIRFITESMRNSAFKKPETFVLNGLLLTTGILIIIYCQFINNWLRNYKVFELLLYWFKNKKTEKQTIKSLSKKFIRKDGEKNFYAYR